MVTINELSAAAGELSSSMSLRAGLNPHSPVVSALASGLDVALTILEQSTGARFSGLAHPAAAQVVQYFLDEAKRSEPVDPQITIFYLAWAQVLATKYLDTAAGR